MKCAQRRRGPKWMTPKRQRRLVDCGEVPFPLPTNRKPSTETEHGNRARKPSTDTGAAHIICHPELAKDLTAGQPALSHHSPFSKLTAPPGEPSVPITCRLKRMSESPREILRKLRMTAFRGLRSHSCARFANLWVMERNLHRFRSDWSQELPKTSPAPHRLVAVEANRPRCSPIRRWRDHNAPRLRRSEWSHVHSR